MTCRAPAPVIGAPNNDGARIAWCRNCDAASKPTTHGPLLEQWRRDHIKAARSTQLRVVKGGRA